MLAKLEPFAEFQPTKLLSHKIEQFLRQYNVTDFACNSFLDTLLLKAGITEGVKLLGLEFVKPDFVRTGMVVESAELAKIEVFFQFLQQYDSTATLEHLEANIHSVRLDATTCLENVAPVFEKAFSERIQRDPDCLKFYQEESERGYSKHLEEMEARKSTLPSVQDKRDAFFSANSKQSAPVTPTDNPVDSPYCIQPQ